MQGIVKFFEADRGWGVLVCSEVPGDVWVHFSVIEGNGYLAFEAGDVVDFDVEAVEQDGFHYRATRAVFIRHGRAPALRRIGGRVVIPPEETPDIPL